MAKATHDKILNVGQGIYVWSKQHGRKNLPWRKKDVTPYEVWVSEIMLQQTQVSRVISFYEKLLRRFPNIESLSQVSWDELLPYYEGLGYYARGKNMLKTAKIVVQKHGGNFPNTKEALMELPGIGEYSAGAILSFGFGKDEIAFDTNFQKIFARTLTGSRNGDIEVVHIKQTLRENFSQHTGTLNAAVMDFSSVLCISKPLCNMCPVAKWCTYKMLDGKAERGKIIQRKRKSMPFINGRVLLILHENHNKYFSSQKTNFMPFLLPSHIQTRADIKKYFNQKYHLLLSVRPPHGESLFRSVPVHFINAQILSGKHNFLEITRADFLQWKNANKVP